MDIIPGAAALKKFSGVARITSFAEDLGKLGKTTAQSSIRKVNDPSIAAGKQASTRLKNAGTVIKARTAEIPTKLANGAIGAGKIVDETITNTKNVLSNLMPGPELAFAGGAVKQTATNTHVVENTMKDMLSNITGLNIEGKGVARGTGNTVSHYLDDIAEAGNVNVTKMNKLKNAIQNNTFSVDELSEISKKMSDLGITKEYNEVLIKIDFGKYLRGLIGDSPTAMIDPHAHHILFKKGLGQKQQELVRDGQEILKKYGIEPIIDKENLVWAPNRIAGQHGIERLQHIVDKLKEVDSFGGTREKMVEMLKLLGEEAASMK